MAERIYCLYDDQEQSKLLAMAYNVKERKEVTKRYTQGQWFSYEFENKNGTNVLDPDTEKKVKCTFPKVAKKEEEEIEEENIITKSQIGRWTI